MECYELDADHVSDVAAELLEAVETEQGILDYGFYMSQDSVENGYSSKTRSGARLSVGPKGDAYNHVEERGES